MAALKYKEEHNKVGYLLKPTGSDDYQQIIDFLSASHIRAPELGPPAILATIDKTPYTITGELVRSRLHLADDGELASPEQTALGKDIKNSFMAVMICQKSLGYFNSPMIHVLRVELVINPPG
uniref:Reverse transcriptase domain-containing protein n=1 Tax=Tanacetum cinerariifolium TaxID=118510 RepID=A0A699H2J5_TANCI|nr:hypothetical protein [Tanacetum cinerariifolium]